MGNKRGLLTLGILCAFTAVVYADKCRSGCQGASSGFFKYEEGASYKYKLDGATITTVAGSSGDVSKVTITADVEVNVQPQCTYVLKVSQVQVNGPDGKAYNGLGDLEAHPVKFSLNDGRVENEVCAEAADSHESLNIKRAIISLFQASIHKDSGVTTHYETDVFGVCPTDFEFSKSGNSYRIKKTRNLNQCAHRESLNFPVISASYSLNSAFQSSPILSSSLKVEQQFKDGVLESAVSDEKYYYQPHLSIDSGATVAVKTKLTFVSKAKGAIAANANKPNSLIFSAPLHSDPACTVDVIQKALQAAESSVEPAIKPTAATDFANLVEVISQSSKQDIVTVYTAAKAKETTRKILLDAITRASNGDAVEVMAELVKANELSELQKGFWILNLGFVKHVTKASLKAVMPLLDDAPHIAYLGIGSFAGRFCNLHDCQSVPEFKELLAKLAAPVYAGCKVDSTDKENKLIASLKGLHNVHHLTDEVAEKIAACAQDKAVKTRVRVAALEAFQSDASKSKIREASIAILKDVTEDSEIRIKAYLALVECPCNKVADVIKNVLDNEKSNQVGSFIVSHLRNVRSSTNPDKAHAKHFLGNIYTKNKFPIDVRKFSNNQELSYSFDAINVGTAGESNVIFSEKSFFPRSVNLNLTTQIFGHAFNLFEFNARSENVDYLLEKYFGPKGYFPTHNPHDIFDNFLKTSKSLGDKIKERYENTIRPKRSIQEQTSAFAKNVVVGGVDSFDKNLDVDLSMKMFGSEVGWYTYTGSSKKFDMSFIDSIFNKIDSSLDKAKNFDIDYKKHATFLDAEAIYPTGLGFPLKVSTRGSGAIRLKVDGKFDLPAMLKDPKNANLDFELIPSAAIELSGQLTVDAFVVESGARIAGNIHSATGSSVSVKLLEGRGVDVKFGLPVKKQEVINFKSNYHTVSRQRGQLRGETPIKFTARKQEYKGCFDQLEELIGLTFCGDVSFPWDGKKALSPAYGTTSLSARIEKDDDSLTTYHFKAYLNNKDPNKAEFEILLDTPNSKTNRKVSFNLDLAQAPNKRLSAVITSPWKAVSLEGQITNTDKEGSVYVKIVHDGTEYYAKAGVNIDGDENHKTLKPMLEYKAPEFKVEKKGLIGFKGVKGDKSQKAVAVEGVIKLDKEPASGKRTYTLQSVKVSTGRNQFVFDGTIVHDDNHFETDVKVTADKEVYKIVSKLAKQVGADQKSGSAYIEFTPSQSPDLGVVVDWKGKKTPYTIENDLTVVHGHDPKSTDSKITIHQFVKLIAEKEKPFEFSTKNAVSYPLVGLSGAIEGEAHKNKISYLLDGTYGKQQVSSSLNAQTEIAKKGDYDINFKAKVLENSVELNAKREIPSDNKSKLTNSLEIKPGGKYILNANVIHNFKRDNFHNHISADLKMPTDPKSAKLDAGIKSNKKEFTAEFNAVAGSKKYVEFEVAVQKTKPQGSFKANLPPNFESQGSYTADNGKGSGSFMVHFPRKERKIEGKSEITYGGNKYKGFADICWDATKNPSKSLKIETDSEIKSKFINSENTITYLGDQKTKINFKGSVAEKPDEEAIQTEAELVLPSGRKYNGKYFGKYSHQNDDYNAEVDTEFSHQPPQGTPCKVAFKANAKNINVAKRTIDGQATFNMVDPEGKDLKAHTVLKKALSGDKWIILAQGSVSGSKIKYPVSAKFDSEVSDQFLRSAYISSDHSFSPASYQMSATVGNEISVASNGKVNGHQLNHDVEVKLPAEYNIKSFKWSSANYFDPAEKIKLTNALNWNDNKFFKIGAEGQKEPHGVAGKLEWESDSKSLRTLTGNVHYEQPQSAAGDRKLDAAVKLAYEGKVADVNVKAEYAKESETAQVLVNGNLPQQGKFDISVKNKATPGGKGFQTDISLNVNEKKITVSNHVELDPENPLVDLVAEHPQGKSKVYVKLEKKGQRHWGGESKVVWVGNGGGSLAVDGEVQYESIDDFFIKMNADSPKLKIDKYNVEVANKNKGAKKTITFQAKMSDKTLFAGNANYNFKDDGKTKTVDGTGTITVADQTHPLKFKYTRDILSADSDGEDGNTIKVNVGYGKSTIDVYSKMTATVFHIKRTYCKEGTDCSKAEIFSKVKKHSLQEYDYEFNVNLDLSKLFKTTDDLSVKITTKRNGFILDHNFELQRNPESKIKYHIFIHDNQAGAVLTLPKRTVAAEIKYELPKSQKKIGVVVLEASLWLNKEKAPQEKTSLSLHADVAKSGEGGSFSGELKASHPALGKDLVISGHTTIFDNWNKIVDAKLDIDVFAKKEQKITVHYKTVKSKEKESFSAQDSFTVKGLIEFDCKRVIASTKSSQLKYDFICSYVDSEKNKREASTKVEINPSGINYAVKIPDHTFASMVVKRKSSGNDYSYTGEYEFLGEKYSESVEIKNHNTLKYYFIFDKNGKNKKFESEFGYAMGQIAEFKNSFAGKELGHVQVSLNEGDFLKSKYNYNTQNLKDFVGFIREDYVANVKKFSKIFQTAIEKAGKEIVHKIEVVQKALPDFAPVVKKYTEEIKALREEVVNEKSIQEAADYIKGVLSVVLEQFVVILEEVAKVTESLLAVLNEGATKFKEALKRVLPIISDSYEKITKIFINVLEEYLKFSVEVISFALDKIKEHEEEIQVIVSAVTEFASEIGQLAAKAFVQIKAQVKDFVELFIEQVKALPVFAMIKEKYEDLSKNGIPEEFWTEYHGAVEQIKEIAPTAECGQFVATAAGYIEKLLRNQPVDNFETWKTLYKEFVAAMNSVINYVQNHIPQDRLVKPVFTYIPLPVVSMKIPKGALRLSPLNWLRSPDIPSIADVFYTYKPTLNPLNYVPPFTGHAYLVGGTDFFTFDRYHVQFKGDGHYLLAQDFVDGNFTISAKIKGGKVEAVVLSDKTDSVELTNKETVNVNGAAHEYPVKQGDLWAWRRYPSANIYHRSGARVFCTPNLHFCSFHVSGYYFGKTKGLLGTINNEVYDELALPDGKLAAATADFANAYALDGAKVSGADAPDTPNSVFQKLIGGDSSLSDCFPYVRPHHYKHACNFVTSSKSSDAEKKTAACEVAYAYHAACHDANSKVDLPAACIKCKVGSKTIGGESDESTTVNVPEKSADIVLVVQQVEQNEEVFNKLVVPLVTSIKKDFKDKGITDVHFSLIGFGAPDMNWPQHYTTNGKIDFNGKSTIYFSKKEAPKEGADEHDKYVQKLKWFKHNLELEFGMSQMSVAFKEARDYPFRPEAVKSIIAVLAAPCERSFMPISLQHARAIGSAIFFKLRGVQFHVITQVQNLEYSDKEQAIVPSVVGFNKDNIYLLSDKKKPSNDLNPYGLTYGKDICVTFTTLNGGTVFNAANFVGAKPDAQKQFLQVVSSTLVDQLTSKPLTVDVTCEQSEGIAYNDLLAHSSESSDESKSS
ncbi:hypothetical protein LSTR_LSTR004460 [Laodelphax striatellus]|uniref:Vitellogenin domain-containing protein n=1 Tax=Laodelphax striatellus TaxID=195883 RepID=A0A482XFN7_LAOST|nr:hypothetical protein LSTR_LSTR004460 [Laodelphax striatellus]